MLAPHQEESYSTDVIQMEYIFLAWYFENSSSALVLCLMCRWFKWCGLNEVLVMSGFLMAKLLWWVFWCISLSSSLITVNSIFYVFISKEIVFKVLIVVALVFLNKKIHDVNILSATWSGWYVYVENNLETLRSHDVKYYVHSWKKILFHLLICGVSVCITEKTWLNSYHNVLWLVCLSWKYSRDTDHMIYSDIYTSKLYV